MAAEEIERVPAHQQLAAATRGRSCPRPRNLALYSPFKVLYEERRRLNHLNQQLAAAAVGGVPALAWPGATQKVGSCNWACTEHIRLHAGWSKPPIIS